MKNYGLQLLLSMTKYMALGLVGQFLLFTLVLASEGNAQKSQSVKEVYVNLGFQDLNLKDVFNRIESSTDFKFTIYENEDYLNKKLSLKKQKRSVEQLLTYISQETGLIFQQINNNIGIKKGSRYELKRKERVEVIIQSKAVRGKVTSNVDEEGLPGVNVVEKGTANGTVTDVNGEYNLTVSENATLVFSSVGFTTEEIELGNRSVIDLVMTEDVQQLQELVVIGYGEMKKSDLTGAVSVVQGNEISERKTAQVSQALQGAVPGVMVTRNNNAPGSSAQIRIRGITTIGDSNPLIIVDGVPMNDIDDINPNDIENISVLKDAASASIYGSRAASGVIVVTTKRAKAGQLSLDYNIEYGVETPTEVPDYVDVVRYMQMTNELRWNDNGNDANEFPLYPEDVVNNYSNLNAENPNLYPNTNWVDLILKNTAPRMRHSLGISGGNEFIRSKASLVYDKFDALYDGRSYERITTRINNDATIGEKLNATVDLFYNREIINQPSRDPMYFMYISAPVYAAEWSDGRVAEGKTGANIYGQVKYGGFRNNWNNQIGGRAALNYMPFKGFKLSAVVAPNLAFNKGKNFQKRVPYYAWDDPSVFEGTLQWASATNLSESRNDNWRVTTQFLANYNKEFGAHSLSAMAGYENFQAFNESLDASRNQFLLDNYPYLNLGPLEFRDNGGSAWENAYRSWFGRVSYSFMDRYFLQANIRYDASSRFHEDYRWGSFPSFSAGWVLSEESFLQGLPVVSFLKLRGSWGRLGNERIGNYPYQSTIGFSNALFFQGSNVVSAQTAAQWQYAIQDISWETTESFNIGLDANFFDYRLRFSGEYYKKTTQDMLLPLEIPDYIGFDNPDQNTGEMYTNGWEIETGWADNLGELDYSFSFNLSDFKSTMGDLGGIQFLGDQIKFEGSEFNEWYGYQSEGLFQTQEEVNNSPVTSAAVRPGDVKYRDISGPEGVPDGVISGEYDRTLLGGSLPRYMYGGNIKLGFRNFDFGLVVQGVGKRMDRLGGLMVTPLMENWGHIPAIIDGNYWSEYNTAAQNQGAAYPRLTRNGQGNNYTMSDYWLFNGAYFRLKNITLGYTIPASLTERLNLRELRVYGNFSDIFTLNKYPKGWDPEVSSTGYPITTSIIFGLGVKF